MQATDAGTIELQRRLDSYARARLSPSARATARTRARVMREARLSFDAARIAVHVAPALMASRRTMQRRMLMPFLAAAVWLGIAVGSISAAQPGGPLFPTRMWIENAALPSDLGARTTAELDRLDARLAESLAGAASGDRAAVAAALDAYYQIADEVSATSEGNADLEIRVTAALGQHEDVLTAIAARLADKGNATAADAIERNIQRTIEHNAAVVKQLDANGAATPNGGAGGAGGNGSTGSGANGSGGQGGGPAATPPSAGTHDGGGDKPERTPKPTPAAPDHTPRGQNP